MKLLYKNAEGLPYSGVMVRDGLSRVGPMVADLSGFCAIARCLISAL